MPVRPDDGRQSWCTVSAIEIGDGGVAREVVERLGGTAAMEQAFIAIAFSMLAMVASAFVISLTLRLHQEETAGRAETVLSGAVDRTRWLREPLVMAIDGDRASPCCWPAW